MRRLPIYFLIDVSESMIGTPIQEVSNGMRTIVQTLRVDPYALETVYVSVIAFAGKARVLTPLTELYKFYPPEFPIGGGTALGRGLDCLMDAIDSEVQKTTLELKGDWKPIVFLFTDGTPTDDSARAIKRWNRYFRNRCNMVALAIGDNVDLLTLAQLTDDVLMLKETDSESFSKFFKWISASIVSTSVGVEEEASDGLKLASTAGINLEKVDVSHPPMTPDENYAVLHGRCQSTHGDYLIKYGRRFGRSARNHGDVGTVFRLVGAYPVDKEMYEAMTEGSAEKINSMKLEGMSACPCCGNASAGVVCQCGKIFCADDDEEVQCPWCGVRGYIDGSSSERGINVSRGLG